MTRSVLDDLGEEITGIVAPVSICMALVVVLVKALNPDGMADSSSVAIATIAYHEQESDSAGQKLGGALLNALIFMAVIGGMTFVLFLLFKWGCYKVIYGYMGFAMFNVFFFLTGALIIQLLRLSGVHMDLVSFCFLLFNFSVVGILSLFFMPVPLFLKQCYTVWVGICVAYIFTHVPEWTSWVLLVIMALYDLAAVLLPGGPLKILVELAIERQQELPALVYEARPTSGPYQRGMWRNNRQQQQQPAAAAASGASAAGDGDGLASHRVALLAGQARSDEMLHEMSRSPRGSAGGAAAPGTQQGGGGPIAEGREAGSSGAAAAASSSAGTALPAVDAVPAGGVPAAGDSPAAAARLESPMDAVSVSVAAAGAAGPQQMEQREDEEGSEGSLGLPDAIKLGLGDFIFYSMLVGRAAMYDMMTVFASYLAVIAGLVTTLLLLALARKALPALPVSIALGVLFYFLTRLVMEPVMVPLSLNLTYY